MQIFFRNTRQFLKRIEGMSCRAHRSANIRMGFKYIVELLLITMSLVVSTSGREVS